MTILVCLTLVTISVLWCVVGFKCARARYDAKCYAARVKVYGDIGGDSEL